MPPKRPFKVPKFPKKQTTPTTPTPTTLQDFFDLALDHEEQGDRWLISDLSKSLRAYQKAFEYYRQALQVAPNDTDSCYNYLRLIYHVYDTYKSVPSVALSGVESCVVHLMGLMDVKKEYRAIVRDQFDGWLNWECGYNEVLINTEIIEEGDINADDMVQCVEESVIMCGKLIEFQVAELDSFIKRLESGNESADESKKNGDGEEEEEEEEEFQIYEQITPSSILETITAGFRLVLASFEFCDDRGQVDTLYYGLKTFIDEKLAPTSELLLPKFDPEVNTENMYQLNVSPEEILELRLTQQCVHTFLISNYTELLSSWDNYTIDSSPTRYLAEADSLESFRRLHSHGSEDVWSMVSKENQCLKRAQELVQKELEDHRAKKTTDISVKVTKIVQVLINRADNELLRSELLDYEPSVKNSEVLKQNAINLLKSGMNVAQSNVGLRERISDKLAREKVRRECIVRLVLLTKEKPTQEDFVRNLGAGFWEKEVDDVRAVDLYRHALERL